MNRDRVTIMPRAKNKEGDTEGLVVPGTLLVTRWGTHPSTEKDSYSILTVPTGTRAWVMSKRGDVGRGCGTALKRLGLVRAEDTGC